MEKGTQIAVLDKGFVQLVDWMGTDADIATAARTSYGEKRSISDDATLIRYLMRHRHTTPFEMCELKFRVKVPMDCWRQWIRHRMASVNEYSTRYTDAIDECQQTSPDAWRLQASNNKQGSSGEFVPLFETTGDPGTPGYDGPMSAWIGPRDEQGFPLGGHELTHSESLLQSHAREVYKQRLSAGVAREQARKDLPLSNYTLAYWKIDLHNLLHFLGLRMDSHAQLEIRQYATVIGEQFVAKLFPVAWQAFLDYRVNAINLTALDQQALTAREFRIACLMEEYGMTKREVEEYLAKCKALGFSF
jgi:thymidylate synthase (FAD)